jgi:hypothetical protein
MLDAGLTDDLFLTTLLLLYPFLKLHQVLWPISKIVYLLNETILQILRFIIAEQEGSLWLFHRAPNESDGHFHRALQQASI